MKNFTHWNLDTKNIGLLVFLISLLFSFTMDLKSKFKISRIIQLIIFIRIKTNDHGPLNHWRHNKNSFAFEFNSDLKQKEFRFFEIETISHHKTSSFYELHSVIQLHLTMGLHSIVIEICNINDRFSLC